MDAQEQEHLDAIRRQPHDQEAKRCYEQYLAEHRPDSVEHELLARERAIAEHHRDEATLNRLVDEYLAFRTQHSNYFWDRRGDIESLQREFKLWLVSFHPRRLVAVQQAMKYELSLSLDIDNLPQMLLSARNPVTVRATKEKLLGFIERYKGPTGEEPEVTSDEVVFAITAAGDDTLE